MKLTYKEKFEKWANAEGYMLEKRQDNQNSYEFDSTRYAWEGYTAAQAEQATTIAQLQLDNTHCVEVDKLVESQQAEITRINAVVEEMKVEIIRLTPNPRCNECGWNHAVSSRCLTLYYKAIDEAMKDGIKESE